MKNESWVERREFSLRSVGKTITGYPAVFESLSENLGGFFETIRPGAFDPVLRDDVRATIDHLGGVLLLGRTRSGTLRLSVDRRGLFMEIDPPETTAGQDVRILIGRGDLNQGSFMFDVDIDRVSYRNGVLLREILLLKKLYDVSVVTFPAYAATEVGVRKTARPVSSDANTFERGERSPKTRLTSAHLKGGITKLQQAVSGRAVRSPRFMAHEALDQLTSTRCECGKAAVEIRRSGRSVVGRCATHQEVRPRTLAERRLELAAMEREIR